MLSMYSSSIDNIFLKQELCISSITFFHNLFNFSFIPSYFSVIYMKKTSMTTITINQKLTKCDSKRHVCIS